MADKPANPLFVHAIMLMIIGLALAAFGAKEATVGKFSISSLTRMDREMKSAGRTPKFRAPKAGKGPTGGLRAVTQGASQLRQAKNALKRKMRLIKKVVSVGWMLIVGIGMIVMGVFVLKQKNWARIVGFFCLGLSTLFVCARMGAQAHAGMSLPIALMVGLVVSGFCAKFLWDLMVEKFETT